MRSRAEQALKEFDIKAPGTEVAAGTLSGGNLQKLVIAREFADAMKVLVAASPTRGLDVEAVETVHDHLLAAAESGAAVLLISEDIDEILALADRVVVMYEGRLSEVSDRDDVGEIGLRMAGLASAPAAVAASVQARRTGAVLMS
jgi:general nucleoside transport system ATP-binding protein